VNGVLAPFLFVGILVVTFNKELMKDQPSDALNRWTVGLTAVIMVGAATALFLL
jgi:Mn2+/Fe2+ NRAMP family transporter